jgi:hypothetical protein
MSIVRTASCHVVRLLATAVLAAGLLASTQQAVATSRVISEPTVSVSPSRHIKDGATVKVSVRGFGSEVLLVVAQCARVEDNAFACNLPEWQGIQTDRKGAGSVRIPARRSFDGLLGDESSWGTVNCQSHPGGCLVVVTNQVDTTAVAHISFR